MSDLSDKSDKDAHFAASPRDKRHYTNVNIAHDASRLPASAQSDMERIILPSAKGRE